MSPQARADASPTSDPKHFCDCGTAPLPSLPSLHSPCWAWSTICHLGVTLSSDTKRAQLCTGNATAVENVMWNDWGRRTVIKGMYNVVSLGFSFHDTWKCSKITDYFSSLFWFSFVLLSLLHICFCPFLLICFVWLVDVPLNVSHH